jgi:predicted metal-dependent hydrolase
MRETSTIHIVRSHRKTIALHVRMDGTIEVKAPYLMPKFFINKFIESNREWIEKRTKTVEKAKSLQKTYADGEKFLYLGEEYTLQIGDYTKVAVHNKNLLFPKALVFRIKKEIENWYISQAKEIIEQETKRYAQDMQTSFTSITYSDTKSQWGRCTYDNRLQFSWRLIMTPLLVLRYVVIHELAHTLEKNHSYVFWSKVKRVNPSYKQQIKWLKEHGNTLVS